MEKKRIIFLIIITFALFINVVYAESCDAVEKKTIIEHAANIKITYVPISGEEIDSQDKIVSSKRFIDIKIYNVTSDLFFNLKGDSKTTSLDKTEFDYRKMAPDGTITLRMEAIDKVTNYILEMYTFTPTCSGEKIKTINIKVPKFNYYSQLEACNGIPEFYLCQEYIDFDIDKSKFLTQVEAYRSRKEETETENPALEDLTSTQRNINVKDKSYLKHIIFIIVVIVGVVGGYFVIKRKKKEPEIW